MLYGGLVFLTGWSFTKVPTGFVPTQDKQYLVAFAQLPDAASLDRSEAVLRKMADIGMKHPGVQSAVQFPGLSISGLPASFSYGLSVQLKAIATLSDGTQKETLEVAAVWQSSDKSVATVSDTGLLVVTGFGDADVTATFQNQEARAHVALPKPSSPPPVARLDVTIDSRGSKLALAGVSEITFDMSRSAGSDLHYNVDFGDGTSSSGTSVAKHVYDLGLQRFIATATVTDGLGRTGTVTREVIIIPLRGGTWNEPALEHRLRFNSEGPLVIGEYWNANDPLLKHHPFTGTVSREGDMRLVLDDQSMTFDGAIVLDGVTSYQGLSLFYGSHLLLTIHGGAADGSTREFRYRDAY